MNSIIIGLLILVAWYVIGLLLSSVISYVEHRTYKEDFTGKELKEMLQMAWLGHCLLVLVGIILLTDLEDFIKETRFVKSIKSFFTKLFSEENIIIKSKDKTS